MNTATVDTRQFEAALKSASAATKNRSCIPMLEQVYMAVSDKTCCLMGTDLTQWVEVRIPVKNSGAGFSAILADTAKVLKACKYYKDDLTIRLWDTETQRLNFSSGDLRMECGVIEDEYPSVPSEDPQQSCKVNAGELHKLTAKMKYAAAGNDSRPSLMGVQFRGDTVFCVDGYRMAGSHMKDIYIKRPVSIPLESMTQLAIFGNETVSLSIGKRYAVFSNGRATVTSRLLDGEVMDPDKVVPKSYLHKFPVDTVGVIQGIKYLRDISGKRFKYAEYQNGELRVEANSLRYSAALPIQGGEVLTFSINPLFFLEGISQFKDCKAVELHADGNPLSPILLTDDRDNFALILTSRPRSNSAAA